MNKIHRIVWSRTSGRWVVASEHAKGRRKGSRRVLASAAALVMAVGVAGLAQAAQPGSYAAGILNNSTDGASCLSSTQPGVIISNTTCDSDGRNYQAALVSYNAAGDWGAFVTVANPETVLIGAGGRTELQIMPGGIIAHDSLWMMNNVIRGVGAGLRDEDAVNVGQLKATGQSAANALGTTLNADGTIASPGYALTNAGTITGTSGTAADVGAGFAKVDGALGVLDSRTIATSRYFKASGAGNGSDDAVTSGNAQNIAIGAGAVSSSVTWPSIAIGSGAKATHEGAIALGYGSRAIDQRGIAIGLWSKAGMDSIAFGSLSNALPNNSILFGSNTTATASWATVFGTGSSAGYFGTAFGIEADARADNSMAAGRKTFAAQDAIAVGNESKANAAYSTAIGRYAQTTATAANSVALGAGSTADRANTVSVGTALAQRQVVNVAAGTADTDAVNVSQLRYVAQSAADALGGGSTVNADGTISRPTISVDGGTYDNVTAAIENVDARTTQNTVSISNLQQSITNISNGTTGLVQQAAPGEKLTVGKDTDGTQVSFTGTAGDRKLTGVAAGTGDTDAVNVSQLRAAGLVDENGDAMNAVVYDSADKDSVTLGGKNAAKKVKLKNVADATQDDEAVNLGQLKATGLVDGGGNALDAVVYDAGSDRGVVTFGGKGGTLLTNVRDGVIATGSRDAVNGGQIAALRDSLQTQVTNIDNRVTNIEQARQPYFDGRGDADTGDSKGMSSARPAGSAPATDEAKATGRGSVAAGANATASADGAVALGANSVADRANTVSVGSAGAERQVVNVAAGNADTDAVNVAQLNARLAQGNSTVLSQANSYTDQRINDVWNDLGRAIDEVDRQANRGIAAASALVNVTPYVPGHTAVNAGVASYRGEAALGVGVSRWSDDGHVNFNAGMSASQGDQPIFRVGVGYVF